MPDLKVVVPLDGTALSETALSVLPALQPLGKISVRLVSVWDSSFDGGEVVGERMVELTEQGNSYLTGYLTTEAEKLTAAGFTADFVVRQGRPAEEVLEEIHAGDIDLVVMSTHGRSGIERFRLGSVADKIVRASECPTLVIGPNVVGDLSAYKIGSIAVPVDGSAIAEESLPVAAYIARQTGASIRLVRAVTLPPLTAADGFGPVDIGGTLQMLEEAAIDYLEKQKASLDTGHPVETAVITGASAEQIVHHLRNHPVSLVVMTSRGRGGIARAALGSVTDRTLQGPAPVLVLRPEMDGRASNLIRAAAAK
jgi:nucleotide-binding universal stress UspA family protein